MDARAIIGSMACVFAFLSARAVCIWAFGRLRRRRAGRLPAGMPRQDSMFARALRNGMLPLSLMRRLLAFARVGGFAREGSSVALSLGCEASPEAFLSAFLAATIAAGALGGIVSGSAMGAAAAASCCAIAGSFWVRSQQERRVERMREAVPDVLQSMRSCFQSGLSLLQTLEHVAAEEHGGAGRLFARGAHALRAGATAQEALAEVRKASDIPEFAFVALALDVQHQAGGSLSRVLDAACEMALSEIELARSLRVQTAQARLSARVVGAMPVVLIALFSLFDADFLAPFFESAAGFAMLLIAVVLQAAGVMAVRRTLRSGEG